MLGNYLKTALRTLLSEKLYSLINLAGLSVGLACFILIMVFVQYELSYERFFSQAERIYRISMEIYPDDGSPGIEMARTSPQVASLVEEEFPQVERAGRLYSWRGSMSLADEDGGIVNAVLADNSMLTIFDFVWLQGSPEQALIGPGSVVLTETTARQYFPDTDPMGETLFLENSFPVQVTGVIEDLPGNTHLEFDMLASIALTTSLFAGNALENWSNQGFHTYVLMADGSEIENLQAQFPGFIERHMGEGASTIFSLTAIPLLDIHLHSNRLFELSPPGSRATVNAFIAVALIVLLVACVNFMNLATVKAEKRAREIGVRKAIGAMRSQVMLQFLGEALMLTAAAVLVALVMVELMLPAFGAMLQRELELSLLDNRLALPFLIALTFFVGLVSSSYSSFYLSSYKPALVLKGIVSHGKAAVVFRSALVVLQFSVAVVLLISTATIYLQLEFMRTSDPGYDKEQIVVLDNTGREGLGRQWDQLKEILLNDPDVVSVTASNNLPTEQGMPAYYINYEGGQETRSMPVILVDYDYFETYDITPVAGRIFSEEFGQDRRRAFDPDTVQTSGTYILNTLAAAQLGWTPDEAIGKWLEVTCCNFGRGVVVGVVEEVQYGSMRFSSSPVLYLIPPEVANTVTNETRHGLRRAAIKISSQQIPETLAHIDDSWERIRPNQPISRYFLDEDFNTLYGNEERQGRMMAAFSLLAVLITCMGLYGLAVYNAQRRTKEVGVRKVMGSSVWGIVLLLTNDFSRLVLLSNIVAWPVAYFAMERWLENFAYRIDLTPLIFIGSGLVALCIAWVTVGGTAAKAASRKPVLALRYE